MALPFVFLAIWQLRSVHLIFVLLALAVIASLSAELAMMHASSVATSVGVVNPWTHLGELSSLLVLVFVVDASIRLRRMGNARDRRLALVVGGSITLFIVVATGWGRVNSNDPLAVVADRLALPGVRL